MSQTLRPGQSGCCTPDTCLQRTATHYKTLRHTATFCNTLHNTAIRCNTLQQTSPLVRLTSVMRAVFMISEDGVKIRTYAPCRKNATPSTSSQSISQLSAQTCCNTLQHTSTHFNTLQHTAIHCNTLQYTAIHCNTLQQHTTTRCKKVPATHLRLPSQLHIYQHKQTATHCNTLQHIAAHCNTLQHTAAHCNTLQHTASALMSSPSILQMSAQPHCNTLPHTATHCNTLQHTATHCLMHT